MSQSCRTLPSTFHDVHHQARLLVGVKVHHVAQGAVRESRAEHRDVVLEHTHTNA